MARRGKEGILHIAYLRADSALYQAGVINSCFERKVLFTITADQDKRG